MIVQVLVMLQGPPLADLKLEIEEMRVRVGNRTGQHSWMKQRTRRRLSVTSGRKAISPLQPRPPRPKACEDVKAVKRQPFAGTSVWRKLQSSFSSRASVYCSIGTSSLQLDPCPHQELGFPLLMATRAGSCTEREQVRVRAGLGRNCRWLLVGQ